MWVIAGLGNPGPKYELTRHNAGFLLLDQAAIRWCGPSSPVPSWTKQFQGFVSTVHIGGEKVLLLKPQTFMNRSGFSIVAALQYYKLDASALLVVHDELDLSFGTLKLKQGGGLAGHNGLRSTAAQLGTNDFARLRFGIGSASGTRGANYVLQEFSKAEQEDLPALLETSLHALEAVLRDGISSAMNEVNRRS